MGKPALSDILRAPTQSLSDAEYFAAKAGNGPPLKPLGKPCHDCAVVWEFYSEVSDCLALQPEPIRSEASLRWHCHNHPDRACRGNIDRIAGRALIAAEDRHG